MKNNKGFTIMEVLVAGMILFAVIATVTSIYKNSLLASQVALKNIKLSSAIPLVLDETRIVIRTHPNRNDNNRINGDGTLGSVSYRWVAREIRKGAPPSKFDPEVARTVNFAQRYKLWEVELTMIFQDKEQVLKYREVSW